jgi:CIC family chloride channel protein
LIIGATVGLVVVAFILLTENLGARLYPTGAPAWRRILIPVAGALGTGFMLARYFPQARGSGIPQTKTALFLHDGFISLRTVVGKFTMCAVTLASGMALGREGPSVQVGAGLASVLGRRLGLSKRSVEALVPIGAAAALAAAFNTPIAAVLFTLEEVMGDLHAPVLGSIVLSSATSWIVLHLLLGDEPLFHVPAYQLVHPIEFLFYAVLGVAGGLVSVAFVKLLLWQRQRFLRMPKWTVWFQPVAGGLLVGLLGWFAPAVLGVGYGYVGKALNGQMMIGAMALLVCLKMAATTTCYASGNAGGIFGPSLFIGAMMGGAVGGSAHLLMPDYTGSVGAYALVGMGAAFAGIIRVPLTSVIMIFEITRDYSIIVPLMIANLISYFISSRLQAEPIYEALQHQDGIRLPAGARDREEPLTVQQAYRAGAPSLEAGTPIRQAAAMVDRERGAWPVVDGGGLRGMLTLDQLDAAEAENPAWEPVGALVPEPGPIETLGDENFPHVHRDHPLDMAMRRLTETGLKALPVVSRENVRRLHGTISLPDILAAYGAKEHPEPALSEEQSGRTLARLATRILIAVLAVGIVTSFLAYYYRSERMARAQGHFQAGQALESQGRNDEAIAQFRTALSSTRRTDYRLALGLALVNAGSLDEASIYLSEALQENPASGPANLGLGRIAARQGKIDDAVPHYQRAIYGQWPQKTPERHLDARLELAETLAKAGRTAQAQAELLTTAAALPDDAALRQRVARMLIDYGVPESAVQLLRGDAEKENPDGATYLLLGDAEFAAGGYAGARREFDAALRMDPGDAVAARRSEICGKVLALDPTQAGVPSAERFRRSRELLQQVLGEVVLCAKAGAGSDDAVRAAQLALAANRRPASYSDAAEANQATASQLWAERIKQCSAPPGADDAAALVMGKLARR